MFELCNLFNRFLCSAAESYSNHCVKTDEFPVDFPQSQKRLYHMEGLTSDVAKRGENLSVTACGDITLDQLKFMKFENC